MSRYRTIVADPPWPYSDNGFIAGHTPASGKVHERVKPYEFLPVAAIAAMPMHDLTADDARLFLWATNRFLPDAFGVVEAWGFRYRQTVVWRKTGRLPPLSASVAPNHAEFLLVGVKGKPERLRHWTSNVVAAPRLAHSVKPDVFLDLVEQVSPGPYLEMFARRARFGWDYWGDESLGTAEMPEAAA
jgi:N6-adenosine-specific RNA methylase IME4